MNPTVTDADVFKVLDKISDYEQLLIELCAVIQDGHILLSRAQYDSGMFVKYSSISFHCVNTLFPPITKPVCFNIQVIA